MKKTKKLPKSKQNLVSMNVCDLVCKLCRLLDLQSIGHSIYDNDAYINLSTDDYKEELFVYLDRKEVAIIDGKKFFKEKYYYLISGIAEHHGFKVVDMILMDID